MFRGIRSFLDLGFENVYVELGFDHILDPQGYDHILFVVALAAIYVIKEWKQVLILVTAFTIGHSVTLALASLNIVKINTALVEILIPITIILTCIFNMIPKSSHHISLKWNYILALGFGLIHGLGFSTYFKAILGKEESIVYPLFAFNVGVELGQVVIVSLVMYASWIFVNLIQMKRRYWNYSISFMILLWSVWLLFKLLNN